MPCMPLIPMANAPAATDHKDSGCGAVDQELRLRGQLQTVLWLDVPLCDSHRTRRQPPAVAGVRECRPWSFAAGHVLVDKIYSFQLKNMEGNRQRLAGNRRQLEGDHLGI